MNEEGTVNEEGILKTIIEKESWEEIIYYIVSLESLDPWDVDLIKLTDRFIKFVKSVKDLDFKIPAKVIFVSVILLKLKANYLSIFEEKEEDKPTEEKPPIDLGIDPNLVQLGYPMKRTPKRQVSLDELIGALKKALQVREKKVERQFKIRTQIQKQFSEEDVSIRIQNIFKEIQDALAKSDSEKIKL